MSAPIGCGDIKTARRFYLLMSRAAAALSVPATGPVWRANQIAQPGVALPSDFPSLEKLNDRGYFAVEDLDGASVDELTNVGLSRDQANQIFAALAPLI